MARRKLTDKSWDDTYKYLAAVADWYDHIVPLIKPFVASRCVVAVQVDNETNQYWANR